MLEIDDYVLALYWREMGNKLSLPSSFERRDLFVARIRASIDSVIHANDGESVTDTEALADYVFEDMLKEEVFAQRIDRFAGSYFSFRSNRLLPYQNKRLSESAVHPIASEIGEKFYKDVFGGFRGENPLDVLTGGAIVIPASDRIVSLGHNQIAEFEHPLEELLEQLQESNGIPEEPGLKERLVGQVKAGRELIRSGNFKAYLLYATLIRALGELIERYQGTAIAMVAASLVDLLVKKALNA